MAAPKDVLSQLLSAAQAEVLDAVGADAWQAAATTFEALAGAVAGVDAVNGRLVMPEEITGEYEASHLVLPLALTTNQDQTAMAYATALTADAAAFFDTVADDPAEQEQTTILLGSTMLGQVVQAINRTVFSRSTNGLSIAASDIEPNAMPAILGAMDEPALALSATMNVGRAMTFTLVLPGTFLDIVAGAMPAASAAPAATAAAPGPAAAAPGPAAAASSPFSLTLDELDAAPLLDEMPAPRQAPPPPPPAAPTPLREPTPIAQVPAAHRARFAPLPDPEPAVSRGAIDLLAGLEMQVCVELGRTELTVSEVLGLGAGSVIELNRLAGEPVDILVNDRLIARGEVVVVDENFGVRVVEIVRRGAQDREEVAS